MGFLDYLNNPQSSFQQDALPNWLTAIMGNPQMLQAVQGGAELPPNKQLAGPAPMAQPMPQAEPRRSIFSPPDTYDGAPPLDRPNPFGVAQPQPMQALGMSAMAQGQPSMAQGQPSIAQGQPQSGGGFMQGVMDSPGDPIGMLWGGIKGAMGVNTGNVTVNTLMKRGGFDRETAMAIKSNPTVLAKVMTDILGASPTSGIVINGRLVDPKTGRQIADYSDTSTKAPDTKEFETPGGGKVAMQWNASNKKWEPVQGVPNSQQLQNEIDQRREALIAQGLDPKDPHNRAYVLTGKMPREDQQPLTATDKKAILEADEGVSAAETAISALKQAKVISKKAYGGPLAGARGYVTGLMGDEAGQATTELDNLLTTNALGQMKAIFGGNPTEGERKILLEIQGASSQPDAVRQGIMDRAIKFAERRLEFNKRRSDEMRGGTFYKTQLPKEQAGQTLAPPEVAQSAPALNANPPPAPAVEALRRDPSKAAQFDAKYGPGASRAILGGR